MLRLPQLGVPELWRKWFAAAGIANPTLTSATANLGAQHLECLAAVAGQGAAIVTPDFFKAEIALGQLEQPFAIVADEGRGYWVMSPRGIRHAPKIRAFRQWIMQEAAQTAGPSAPAPG
jgi:LysR family glycine cleavage system transcriptional activator